MHKIDDQTESYNRNMTVLTIKQDHRYQDNLIAITPSLRQLKNCQNWTKQSGFLAALSSQFQRCWHGVLPIKGSYDLY